MENKKKLIVLGLSLVLILLTIVGMRGYYWLTKNQIMGELITHVDTDDKVIALTFDDGPNPEITNQMLALLDKYNAKATFFVVGKYAKQYPETLVLIHEQGCEIGNHSWSHKKMQFKSMGFLKRELASTDSIIRASGYTGTIHFRSPYGSRLFLLPYLLSRRDIPHVLWSVHLDDWKPVSVDEMYGMFEVKVKPGAIVLLHDGVASSPVERQNSVEVLEMILRNYSQKGYSFITLSELFELK